MSINYRALTCTARAAPDRWGKRGRVREEDGNGGGGRFGQIRQDVLRTHGRTSLKSDLFFSKMCVCERARECKLSGWKGGKDFSVKRRKMSFFLSI